MLAYILRRIAQSILVLLIVMLVTFTLPYFQVHGILAPAYQILGVHATPKNVAHWAAQNGMNHPYIVRFWNYVTQVFFHFNLGRSYKQNNSVWGIIKLYVPRTIWLALSALILTIFIAIPLGIFQASKRNTVFDYSATGSAFVLYAMPSFLLCMLVLDAFSFHWPHLPSSPPGGVAPWAMFTNPVGFILPVACLTMLSVAGLSRFMRGTVLEVLVQDYVRTAKAKGCTSRRTLFRHAFRNALGPIITILGLSIPALLGGALIIESVFNYGGLGIQTVTAATNLDIPTVLGITLLVAILTLAGNLMADIALGLVNPRIRIEGAGR
ncbi:MAG TPA: ABC transporter permease [Acidimicrobiales bacterium]|nr:ABC transporter permease [Acidimicrobiales bacterium]